MPQHDFDHAPVRIESELPSTMDASRERARIGNTREGVAGAMVLARRQTGGRGRYGNRWSSPPGGLYLSMIVRPPATLPALEWQEHLQPWLPLTATLAMLRTVVGLDPAAFTPTVAKPARLGIKWPNDLYLDDKKLGGVLVETGLDATRQIYAIVGLGLNIQPPPATAATSADAGDALPPTAISLAAAGLKPVPPPEQLAHRWRRNFFAALPATPGAARTTLKNAVEQYLLGMHAVAKIGFLPAEQVSPEKQETTSGRMVGLGDRAEVILESSTGERSSVSEGHLLLWSNRSSD